MALAVAQLRSPCPSPRLARANEFTAQNPVASWRHADGETTNELARSRSAGRPRVAWFGSFGSFN
ncbi:hypothetical protein T492DRAFT_878817 [Pavlovales sp. CCMP2436]|nr:hypothetical protein T492DRAFT_878817 [Pavlovales sp. CCMP2436]